MHGHWGDGHIWVADGVDVGLVSGEVLVGVHGFASKRNFGGLEKNAKRSERTK